MIEAGGAGGGGGDSEGNKGCLDGCESRILESRPGRSNQKRGKSKEIRSWS